MTIYTNTAEGGTNGTAVTEANSGGASGNPWSYVGPSAGGAFTYSNGHPFAGGGLAVRFAPHATNSYYLRWDLNETVSTRAVMRMTVRIPSAPSGDVPLLTMRGNNAFMGTLLLNSSRQAWVRDGYNAARSELLSPALTAGATYTFEFAVKKATQDTAAPYDGTMEVKIEDASGSVVHTASIANARTRTNNPNEYRFFGFSGSVGWSEVFADNFRAGQQESGWLGPAGVAPPVLALTDQVVHLIDATGSTVPAGSISYAITQDEGPLTSPTELAPGRWAVVPHATTPLVYLVSATGSLGGADDAEVTVPPLTVVEVDGYDETLVYSGSAWL